jgi:hypothetical protein
MKKWNKHQELLDKMIKFLLYDAMREKPDLVRSRKELELYILIFKN